MLNLSLRALLAKQSRCQSVGDCFVARPVREAGARMVAREAVAAGVTEIAQGAEEIGAGEATAAMGAALEERASYALSLA